MEQLVARWAHNPKAAGSSPAPATTIRLCTVAEPFLFTSDVHSLRLILGALSEDLHRVHLQHGAAAAVAQRVVPEGLYLPISSLETGLLRGV